MSEDRFEEFLQRASREFRPPPEAPREAMWQRIDAERRVRRGLVARPVRRVPWLRWGLAAAAVLALGIALGRLSAPSRPAPELATSAGPEAPATVTQAYRVAALQHLSRSEALLTDFRAGASADPSLREWARALLAQTRLLLDSPVARDRQLKALLEDLELVLVQIATLENGGDERTFITEGLERRGVLPRLRTAIPAGAAVAGT